MTEVAVWGYGFAAVVYFALGLYVFSAWRGGLPGGVLLTAVTLSALWAVGCALAVRNSGAELGLWCTVLDILRGAAWLGFLVVLLRPLWGSWMRWPSMLALAVLLAQVLAVLGGLLSSADAGPLRPQVTAWLAHAIVGLVLVEHLFRSLPVQSRWGLKPLCLALGAGYIFELYLFADATLFARIDGDVWAVRGIAHGLLVPFIVVSATRNPSWTLRMAISREVAFHSTALAVAGLYLLVIAAAAYYVRYVGGDWGRALQLALLFAGLLLLGVLLFSGAQRARLKVLLSKHLFSYRYDYRSEWLRFTRSLADAEKELDLGRSVIKALSDLVESPGGLLWLRDGYGSFALHSRLNQRGMQAAERDDSAFSRFLGEREWIINLQEYRRSPAVYEDLILPEWLSMVDDAWLVIPLKSSDDLIGFVVLTTPRAQFDIDWEVLDLLKTAQRQAASYLDRMLAAEALIEARKFDSFNRMSAFVVHDLKNLVAQLALMLKNSERHGSNPEFQKDMLETVAHVEARMRGLMTQLQEKRSIDPARVIDVGAMLRRVAESKKAQLPRVDISEPMPAQVQTSAHPERLERIFGHVMQNALEATEHDGKVTVELHIVDERRLRVVVEDTGCGMSPEFLRERLARPFQTTKTSGMGIGVFETRQYLAEIGGDLHFDSELGRGTRVSIALPRVVRAMPQDQPGAVETDV